MKVRREFDIDRKLAARFTKLCEEKGTTRSAELERILENYLKGR